MCKNPIFHRLVFILLTFVRTTLHRGKGKKTLCVFMKNQTNMNIKISLNWYLKKVSPHTLLVVLLKKSFLHDNLRLNNSLWGIHEMLQSAFTKFWLQLFIAKFLAARWRWRFYALKYCSRKCQRLHNLCTVGGGEVSSSIQLDRLSFWKLESHTVKTYFYSLYKLKIVLLPQLQICTISIYTTTFTSTTIDVFLFLSSPSSTSSWHRSIASEV